jgi:dTDP-4-dehydrorhamnose reductase
MKAIVLGADGTVGSALSSALEQRGDTVYGTTRRRTLVGAKRPFLDLAVEDAASASLPDADVAFFCAAIVSYAECRQNPVLARRVNVTNPAVLARRLIENGSRVVLLSTNAVFNGQEPAVRAERPPCPTTIYGELAADAERQFSAFGKAASIARLTKIITADAKRFINWIDALSRGQAVVAFSDLRMAPISLDDAISALLAIADHRAGGIYQISGAADISYYEAARHIARRLGADAHLVMGEGAAKAGIRPEEITRFSSLDTSGLAKLTGRQAPEPYSVLDAVFEPMFMAAARH